VGRGKRPDETVRDQSAVAVIGFLSLSARGKLIPGRLQSMGELSYEFIANMVKDTTGPEAMRFFPFVFTLFFFILFANLLLTASNVYLDCPNRDHFIPQPPDYTRCTFVRQYDGWTRYA